MNIRFLLLLPFALACATTSHPTTKAELGTPATLTTLRAHIPGTGPISFERVILADWAIDRAGLVNFEHPKAKNLKDGLEPLQLYAYIIRHPRFGTFLIDSGLSADLAAGKSKIMTGLVAEAMHTERLNAHTDTGRIIANLKSPLRGVFLSHLHLDHIFGVPEVANETPLYVGPGEADHAALTHIVTQSPTDKFLAGKGPLRIWPLRKNKPVVDGFGDGSLWVIHTPGHTPGSVAFIVRSTTGPVLITGDTCHTGFGWQNGVEAGTFTDDHAKNRASLALLRKLANEFPSMQVHLGHQEVGQKLGDASSVE